MNKKHRYDRLHVEIDIVNKGSDATQENLAMKVKLKGDCPPSWLAHVIMALCESYKRKMIEREALKIERLLKDDF